MRTFKIDKADLNKIKQKFKVDKVIVRIIPHPLMGNKNVRGEYAYFVVESNFRSPLPLRRKINGKSRAVILDELKLRFVEREIARMDRVYDFWAGTDEIELVEE